MEQIQHKYISVQGLKLHVADIGKGSNVVVFLHGFPDIWYSYRHQMIAAANAGFRAIAPDYRGYGLSDPPPQSEKTSYPDLASDILGILDSLAIPKTEMEQIQHKYITVQGLKLHVAGIGTGPNVIVFLHGFPEIWYSRRHQMIGLAHSGFRAIAPDYHGHGLSDPPSQPDKASYRDLISGLFGILDSLAIPKNFGARPAYLFALAYPDRVLGIITIGVPIMPPGPLKFDKKLPEGFYISRWQEPGRAEADFGLFDAKTVVRNIYILSSRSEIPIAAENREIMDLVDPSNPLPPWFTKEDLAAYGALYEKSGFQTALHSPYRALREESGLTNLIVKVPALYIMGGKDYVNKFPGIDYYIYIGRVKKFVPNLEIQFMSEGSHFVQEQSRDKVNQLIITFLEKHV